MQTKKQIIGQFGEELAIKYLLKKGYSFLFKNVQTSYMEIDLIFRFKNLTIFIEVKTRTSSKYGLAIDALTKKKQQNFKRAVMYYCRKERIDFNFIRVDFVAIQLNKKANIAKINHIKDIF